MSELTDSELQTIYTDNYFDRRGLFRLMRIAPFGG